ncbi:hypothetical protein [Nocardioides zhouii]|uniref:O-antigen ligase family protein n=1 Tax=Nocardioides zhouii TaxID=1168729 RepID=A0A4Q2T0N9_9ACTN|nr:hypothetical protein [Nocardioides zhouii]RYC11533.1 hypothetical protein EUA94_09230 [Nocardioides zhouii]
MSAAPSADAEVRAGEPGGRHPMLGSQGRLFLWPVVTTACVFGPYLIGGVRTEQLALLCSALAAVVVLLVSRRLVPALRPGWPVLALWAAYAATAAVGGVLIESRIPWGSGSLVAGLDNAFLPLATMTVTATWMVLFDKQHLVRILSWMVAGGMAANGAVALATSYVGADRIPLLRLFWAAGGDDVTVAELAAGNGRFSGIFNQPAEAGVAYSLAAFCLVHLMRSGTRVPTKVWLPLWALIVVGGLLTLSKIFVIGGVVVAGGLILSGRRHRLPLSMASVAVVVAAGVLAAVGGLGSWGASGQLAWYVDSARAGNSWAYTLSAGRFGDASADAGSLGGEQAPSGDSGVPEEFQQPGGLVELSRVVLDEHPWFGVGARGLPVSYDATWVETIIVAGLVGLVLMVGVHLFLLVRWWRLRGTLAREEWRLAGAVVLLVWGSSFGMPSLTGNRESSLMWILLALLVVFRSPSERSKPPAESQA